MKIIDKILDRIAVRFLKREMKLDGSGKLLCLALQSNIKLAVDNQSDGMNLSFEQTYKNKKYDVIINVKIEEK